MSGSVTLVSVAGKKPSEHFSGETRRLGETGPPVEDHD